MDDTQGPDPLMWEDPEAFVEPRYDYEPQTYGKRAMSKEMEEYVQGLREMADALEKSNFSDEIVNYRLSNITLDLFTFSVEEQNELSRQLGGFRQKVMEGSYAIYRRNFGPHKIDININRTKICERVQVGERVLPAQEERVEPVYEWVCEDESWVPAA